MAPFFIACAVLVGARMTVIPRTTDASFEADVLKAAVPVLVDFGAEWCGPCRRLDPILAELASEWDGKVRVVRLDIDESLDATLRYGVLSVPTLILFRAGRPVERLTGYQPKHRILEQFVPHIDL